MPRLFSYCIPFDDGAAPNPFWGVCTLNICKPVIRRNAKKGDWIVGTGSKKFGFENKVVYAMEITETLTMLQYYNYCKAELPKKIPNWRSRCYKERIGDCIYDFSIEPAGILKSVHNEANRQRDLGGLFTLLSDHFYYFGDKPESLPEHLLQIVKQGQGHKSTANQPYFYEFVDWIVTQKKAKNKIYSEPNDRLLFTLDNDQVNNCLIFDKKSTF
jgi:hypothetical protein